MTLISGTRLGPYEVTALLGSGGMAEVYRARDTRLGRDVAIKILPDDFAGDAEALARFEREARTASALNHPHLVTIHDIGDADIDGRAVHFIAMELIRGETLRHHMLHDSREELLPHLANIADGLAKAHEAGVIHRDLKPENVMVSEDGFAKVVDFGLARPITIADENRLTSEGFAVGTAGYMAPEQVRGERDLDQRVDAFAFGCMLYECIAKRNPFDGESVIDTMHRILYDHPPPLADAAVDRIAQRCLAKDRTDRYSSMREVARAVREAMEAAAPTVVKPAVSRRRVPWALVAIVAALFAGGVLLAVRRARPPAIDSLAVLPFANATGRPDAAFLGDGIADDVVRDLGRMRALRVIASASASRYRNTSDPQKAARELNVDAVLVGKLRAAGETLLVDAELVNAEDGTAMWSKQYTRTFANVLELEEEIAKDVSASVRLRLAPQPATTRQPEAYEAYLRGHQELTKHTGPGLKNAIAQFHRAIEIDPEYALAYAALAEAHSRQAIQGLVPTRMALMQAEAEGQKALSLDPLLPEAHWALSLVARLRGDDAEYRRREARVLELNPNFAAAHHDHAMWLVLEKRFDEAEAEFRQARALDPFTPGVMTGYANHLVLMRRYDRALSVLLMANEQFPDYANAYVYVALVYSYLGRHEEAREAMARINPENNPNHAIWKGVVDARAGRVEEGRAIAARADEAAKTRYVPPYYRAILHAQLGDHDAALSLLEQAKRDGEWQMTWLPYDPQLDPLRNDPRFAALQ